MRFRVNEVLNITEPHLAWLERTLAYTADWTPGWPKHPRNVRLYSPAAPKVFLDIPITYLTRVE